MKSPAGNSTTGGVPVVPPTVMVTAAVSVNAPVVAAQVYVVVCVGFTVSCAFGPGKMLPARITFVAPVVVQASRTGAPGVAEAGGVAVNEVTFGPAPPPPPPPEVLT